jgi:CrcB protein
MIRQVLFVAIGSALGGVARFLVGRGIYAIAPTRFPLPTLLINVLGCFLIGWLYATDRDGRWLNPDNRLLLTTGLCGGFTTFSAFSYENIMLMKQGQYSMMLLYMTASIVLSILAAWLGMTIVK